MNRPALTFAALALAAAPAPVSAQALTKCIAGAQVIDREGRIGTIVSAGSALCQVKYDDGQTYGWIFWNLRPAPKHVPAGAAGNADASRRALPAASPAENAPAPTVLRPPATHTLVYRAGPNGHFVLPAEIDGAPVRLLVDTGASLVFLSPEDARAVGISASELVFDKPVQTGNGTVRAAPLLLREVRIDQLSLDNVQAAVIENLGQSVLGMSFLSRLKGFEMQAGALTIDW
jgi:aspartyl protease family protein